MEKEWQKLDEKLNSFPRLSFSFLPTPCHRLDFFSNRYGLDLYCKRDDLTGFGFGGNKSRKLEFLIGQAKRAGCDTLITSGGIQSNFCRLTAAAGAVTGMSVHLVLGGENPTKATGNVLLDLMLGAHLHFVSSADWNEWEAESEKLAVGLKMEGRKVFRMPIGGSIPLGALGYTAAFSEILKDQARLNLSFDHIFHASSSGGTQAGLVAGKRLSDWGGEITGVSVAMEGEIFEKNVYELANKTSALMGGADVDRRSVQVNDDYIGGGYAVRSPSGEKAIEIFARREGIFLDHVYTGKAAGALLDWLEKGELSGQKVLFLHTGGQVELFAGE